MKKLLILFVAFALTFTLAGCDSTELTTKIDELDQSIVDQLAEITALKGDLADLEADLMTAQSELANLKANQADPAALERATNRVLALQSEIENIYSELYVHNKRLETLETKYTEGRYEPGIYEGSYATATGTYFVTVGIDRNGKIAGYHADFVSMVELDNEDAPIANQFTVSGIEYVYPTTYLSGDYTLDTVTYKHAATLVDAREYTLGYTVDLGTDPSNEAIHMKKAIAGMDGWIYADLGTAGLDAGDTFTLTTDNGVVVLTMTSATEATGAAKWTRTAGGTVPTENNVTFSVTALTAKSDEAKSIFAMLPAGTAGWTFTDVNGNDALDAGDTFAMAVSHPLEGNYGTVTITITDAPVADDPLTTDVDETAGAKGTAAYMWTEDPQHNFRPVAEEVFEAQVAGTFTVENITATIDEANDVFATLAAGTRGWVYTDNNTAGLSLGDTYVWTDGTDSVTLTVTVLPVEDNEATTDVDETVMMEADGAYSWGGVAGLFTAEDIEVEQDFEQMIETASAYLAEEDIAQDGIDMAIEDALAGHKTDEYLAGIDVIEKTDEGMYNPGVYVIQLDDTIADTDVDAYLEAGDTVFVVVIVDENGHYLGNNINVLRKVIADDAADFDLRNPEVMAKEVFTAVAGTDDVNKFPELDYPEEWMRAVFGVDELELREATYTYVDEDGVYGFSDTLYVYEDEYLVSSTEKFTPNADGGYDHLVWGLEAADDTETTGLNEATEAHWYANPNPVTIVEVFEQPQYVTYTAYYSFDLDAVDATHEDSIDFGLVEDAIDQLIANMSNNSTTNSELVLATRVIYAYILTPLTEEVTEEAAE